MNTDIINAEAVTWLPGTNSELDSLFDRLRLDQYKNRSHRLWYNYDRSIITSSVALTICFNKEGNPELCSGITERTCWPKGAYRILNRLWKVEYLRLSGRPVKMSASFGLSANSQINWLKENTDCKLYFMSRETQNWQNFAIRSMKDYGINVVTDQYLYLTCPDDKDKTCWQSIIYNGDETLLELWQRKINE